MTHIFYIYLFFYYCFVARVVARISPARVDSSLPVISLYFPVVLSSSPPPLPLRARIKKIFFFKYRTVNPSIRVRSIGLPNTRGNVQCTKHAHAASIPGGSTSQNRVGPKGVGSRATHTGSTIYLFRLLYVFSFHRLFIQLRDGTHIIYTRRRDIVIVIYPPPDSAVPVRYRARAIGEFNPRRTR